ncbi:uncharacterized protein LOC133469646 [Phyllopteryx taeniolatus]|uniref:uncharacterized protein LOC133469646 n=1 Tax=Phyllopteryx taeniolatus TaxID=161469 RepID=UPI002AD52B1F|nr:uncharacterized protein LOC133469646 [Phyllopteryx taeniolatus]
MPIWLQTPPRSSSALPSECWKLVFSRATASHIKEPLRLPTCSEIFKGPVLLPCGGSSAVVGGERRSIASSLWEKVQPLNLALRNVCEAFTQASVESEDICSLREEKLKLGPPGGREPRLQRDNCIEHAESIKVQREKVERKIRKDFEELCGFLQVEEEARLSAVREEEQEKSQRMKEKMEARDRDAAAIGTTGKQIRVHVDTTERSISFSEYHLANTRLGNMDPSIHNMKMFPHLCTMDESPLNNNHSTSTAPRLPRAEGQPATTCGTCSN